MGMSRDSLKYIVIYTIPHTRNRQPLLEKDEKVTPFIFLEPYVKELKN